MSEQLFGEATVHLTPDLTGFVSELKTQVKAAVEKVEKTPAAKIRISPALTRDFVGQLRKQVNLAVAQAQKGVKPIQIRAVLTDTSQAAIAREVRRGAQTVRAVAPVVAPRTSALGADTSALTQEQLAVQKLTGAERLLGTQWAANVPVVGELSIAEKGLAEQRIQGARVSEQTGIALSAETASTEALTAAKLSLQKANLAGIGTSTRARLLQEAERHALDAQVLASNANQRSAAEGFRTQLRAVQGAKAALGEFSREATTAARNASQLRRGILSTALSFAGIRGATLAASARFLAGAAAIAIFAKAIQSAAATSQQLNVFRATTQATSLEVARVSDNARALGADLKLPGVTALDAAESMTELAKAGLGVQDSIDGARGVLQLATAAAIDNAQAVELAANAINAFGLAGRDATHVADVFANAANAAQGSIVDIGIAFQQASAAGRQVGLSFEDTSTFLTILARNGLKGSDAGTSLRTALIRLIKPTKEAKEELKNLGVETRDAQGNLRPDVFIQLTEATRGLSPAARDAKLALIGGQDAFRAITILGRQSIESFIKLRQELRQQGTAAELAEARMSGLRGSLEGLSNSLSGIGLRAGQALTPALQGIVVGASGVTQSLAESDNAAQLFAGSVEGLQLQMSALGTVLKGVAAAVLPLAGLFASAVNAVGVPNILTAVVAYAALGKALKLVAAAQIAGRVSSLAYTLGLARGTASVVGYRAALSGLVNGGFNPYLIAAAAAVTALVLLSQRESEAERSARKLTQATKELATANERLKESSAARRDTELGVNAAELGVLEAQQAAARARGAIQQSRAAEGSFERTKLELQLAVALDNVKIAQNGVSDAVERANRAFDESQQAITNQTTALNKEKDALLAVADAARKIPALDEQNTDPQKLEAARLSVVSKQLRERAQAAREEGSAESIAIARRLELLDTLAAAVNKIPEERQIDIALNTPNLGTELHELAAEFDIVGSDAAKTIRDQLFKGLTTLGQSPEATAAIIDLARKLGIDLTAGARDAGRAGADGLGDSLTTGIDDQTPKVLSAVDRLLAAIQASLGRSAGLDVQENLAVIASGATGATLPVLQSKLGEARQREADARAAIAASPVGETPTLRKQLRQAIADQAALITQIRGINAQLATDAKSAADDAKSKQDEIFDNILKAMGIRRDARQQAIEDAALTEGSGDDLSATRKLRRLVNVQIDRIRERIRNARKEGLDVTNLIAGLRVLEGIYRDLGRTVRDLQAARRQEIRDRIAESNALDIEFASTTGNKNAEIRARNREIARLKALQSKTKAGTVEYKRLRNLIADQQKAIEELRKQQGTKNQALINLQKQEFAFLQTIQGFTGNLLGNLIPGGIGGLVGGTVGAPPGPAGPVGGFGQPGGPQPGGGVIAGFNAKQGAAVASAFQKAKTSVDAGRERGFTSGQGNTTIVLLRKILAELHKQNRGAEHPEAKTQRKTASATYDYSPTGPGM